MPYLTIDGVKLYYAVRAGDKNVAIFIHGAGGNHLNWYYQLEFLKIPYTLIALDLPAHGNSQGIPCDTIHCYGRVLLKFVNNLKVYGNIVLVGHSMGGLVILDYLLNGGEAAKSILIGSACKLKRRKPPENPQEFCRNLFHSRESIERCLKTAHLILNRSKKVLEQDLKAAGKADYCSINISTPTLLIHGEYDRLVDYELVKKTTELLPRAELKIIKDAGHMVMIEKYREVNSVISNWV